MIAPIIWPPSVENRRPNPAAEGLAREPLTSHELRGPVWVKRDLARGWLRSTLRTRLGAHATTRFAVGWRRQCRARRRLASDMRRSATIVINLSVPDTRRRSHAPASRPSSSPTAIGPCRAG